MHHLLSRLPGSESTTTVRFGSKHCLASNVPRSNIENSDFNAAGVHTKRPQSLDVLLAISAQNMIEHCRPERLNAPLAAGNAGIKIENADPKDLDAPTVVKNDKVQTENNRPENLDAPFAVAMPESKSRTATPKVSMHIAVESLGSKLTTYA